MLIEDTAQSIGKEVARLRKEKELTQAELAQKAKIHLTALRRLEQSGQIQLQQLSQIIQTLGAELEIIPPKNRLPETWEKFVRQKKREKRRKKPQSEGIRFREYPELSKLCWNEHRETISEEDAFLLYLDEWDLVDKSIMPPEEVRLVHRLNEQFQYRLNVREIPSPAN